MQAQTIAQSWSKALLGLFHYKIILLSILPFILSLFLWGAGMWWGMQSLIDAIQSYFMLHGGHAEAGKWLGVLGLMALKVVIVPLLSMWLLLPILIMSSLLFIGVMVMPSISRHVGNRYFPLLEKRKGGSIFGSLVYSISSLLLFVFLWLMSLPLILIGPLHIIVQPLLWGWLTYRVMTYDALASYADEEEHQYITQKYRFSLLFMGIVAGLFGAAPTMFWLGGAMSVAYVAFFPIFVAIAIWLYLLIFIFTGLWFQYFCLDTLRKYRGEKESSIIPISESAIHANEANETKETTESSGIINTNNVNQ